MKKCGGIRLLNNTIFFFPFMLSKLWQMYPYHSLPLLQLLLPRPSMAEMEGRADSRVTGRPGQSGECPSSRQSVAVLVQRRLSCGSPGRSLSVEAAVTEGEAWLRVMLSWKRQARAQLRQQPHRSNIQQHGECSAYLPSLTHSEKGEAYKLSSGFLV